MNSTPDPAAPRAAGLCLVAGPLLLVAATILAPSNAGGRDAYVDAIAAAPGRTQAAAFLFVLGHLVLLPGIVALRASLGGRAGRIAGTAAFAGIALFATLGAARVYETAIAQELTAGAAVSVLEAAEAAPAFIALVIPGLLGTLAGGIALAVVAWRRGFAAAWVPVVMFLGFAGVMTGGDGTAVGAAGSALLTVGLGTLGLRLRGTQAREPQARAIAAPAGA